MSEVSNTSEGATVPADERDDGRRPRPYNGDPARQDTGARPEGSVDPDETAGRDLRGPVGTVSGEPEAAGVPVDPDPRDHTFTR